MDKDGVFRWRGLARPYRNYLVIYSLRTKSWLHALVTIPAPRDIPVRESERFGVLLESIQDPGNLGSILRSAAVAGVCDAYLSKGCADAWSPKTLRAAMGAHFLLRIYEQSNLVKVVKEFKGKVIATTLKTNKSLYKTHLTGPIAFAFGNEGIGLSDEVRQASSEQVTIPMVEGTESLNVAAAAAICFFERVRQTQ
ncbi:MAG: RNA methyltransferase [Proteobacteria bacterium]|nr:RNA methyltransferase [Pseudomonadota bacterium]